MPKRPSLAEFNRRVQKLERQLGGGHADDFDLVFCLVAEPGEPRSEQIIRWGDSPILVIRAPEGEPWNLPPAKPTRPYKLMMGVDPDWI